MLNGDTIKPDPPMDPGPEGGSSPDVDSHLDDIAGVLNTQYGALVDIVIELQAAPDQWSGEGTWTIEQFLAWRMGLSPSTAAAVALIAGRAGDLPVSLQAFRDGRLSLDQMAAIARKAPWWTDAESCDYGTTLTVTQLRRVMGHYPFPNLDADGREIRNEPVADDAPTVQVVDEPIAADSSHADDAQREAIEADPSFCHWYTGDDGRFHLTANLDQETGEIVSGALFEARDQLFQHGHTDVDGVDALREVCDRSLDAIESPNRRSRFKIAMFFETDGTMTDTGGRVIPDNVREHLSCDGTITPVALDNGLPVSVGRAQHIVPDRTRTLIERRDHGACRVPGCTSQLGLEVHHIIHWEHDGPTDTWNLILICAHHHRLHHSGKLGIAGNADQADGVNFTSANGRTIHQSGAAPRRPDRPPSPPPERYQHPLGERLQFDWILFNPPEAHRRELLERSRAIDGSAADYLDSFKRRN
jgi:hypothetical protein